MKLKMLAAVFLLGTQVLYAGVFEDWNNQANATGWFYVTNNAGQSTQIPWREQGGVTNSGYVLCPLGETDLWDITRTNRYYPLYTLSDYHAVNLAQKSHITVSLNTDPGAGEQTLQIPPADLKLGGLTFYVGWWGADNSYAFYFFKTNFAFSLNSGWFTTSLQLTTNTVDWEVVDSQPVPPDAPDQQPGHVTYPLSLLLSQPQQWGFAVVGASDKPSGGLGFDNLWLRYPLLSPQLSIQRTNNGVAISWYGTDDQTYTLQASNSLGPLQEWEDISADIKDPGPIYIIIKEMPPPASSQKYYGVLTSYR